VRRSAKAVFCAFQSVISNLWLSSEEEREIDRPGSTDQDGDRHIDVSPDRIRVRADGMSTLDEHFGRLLVDTSNGYGKRGGEYESSRLILTEADLGDDFDVVIGAAVAGLSTHAEKCILKAGCIAAGEELLGIGRITSSAKSLGQRKLDVEQTVVAANRTVTASGRRDFCGI
jgi:hypothetical protein